MKKLFLSAFLIGATIFTACEKDEVDALNSELDKTKAELQSQISNVQSDVDALDARLSAAIAAEEAARIAGDNDLADDLADAIEILGALIAEEVLAREAGDEYLAESLDSAVNALVEAIEQEAAARIAGDADLSNSLQNAISSLTSLINAEAAARAAGDADLSDRLNAAISTLNDAIAAEAAARAAGDEALQASLEAAIDSLNAAIAAEEAARISGDEALQTSLESAISSLNDAIDAAEAASISGDEALQSELEAAILRLNDAIDAAEAAAIQAAADALASAIGGLQTQIDSLWTSLNELADRVSDLENAPSLGIDDINGLQAALDALQDAIDNIPDTDLSELEDAIEDLQNQINELSGEDYYVYSDWSGTDPGYGTPTVTSSTQVETAGSNVEFVDSTTTTVTTYAAYTYEESRTATLVVVGAADVSTPTIEDLTRTISVDEKVETESNTVQVANPAYVPPVSITTGTETVTGTFEESSVGDQNGDGDTLDSGTFARIDTITYHDGIENSRVEGAVSYTVTDDVSAPTGPDYSGAVVAVSGTTDLVIGGTYSPSASVTGITLADGVSLRYQWEFIIGGNVVYSHNVFTATPIFNQDGTEGHWRVTVTDSNDVAVGSVEVEVSYDPADTLSDWSDWSNIAGSEAGGIEDGGVPRAWSAWSPESADSSVATITQTRSREIVYTTSAATVMQERTRTVVINGNQDATPPAGDLSETQTIETAAESTRSEIESESREIANPDYEAPAAGFTPVTESIALGNQVFGGAVKFYDSSFNIISEPTASQHPITGAWSVSLTFEAEGTYYVTYFRDAAHLADNIANSTPADSVTITVAADGTVTTN